MTSWPHSGISRLFLFLYRYINSEYYGFNFLLANKSMLMFYYTFDFGEQKMNKTVYSSLVPQDMIHYHLFGHQYVPNSP